MENSKEGGWQADTGSEKPEAISSTEPAGGVQLESESQKPAENVEGAEVTNNSGKPLDQEAFNRIYREWKEAEERAGKLLAEKTKMEEENRMIKSLIEQLLASAPEAGNGRGIKLPPHLAHLQDDPALPAMVELVKHVLDQHEVGKKVGTLEKQLQEIQQRWQEKQQQEEYNQRVNYWKTLFERENEHILEKSSVKGLPPLLQEVALESAMNAIQPMFNQWNNLTSEEFLTRYRQNFSNLLERKTAELKQAIASASSMSAPASGGMPVGAKLPSSAPLTNPDPMIAAVLRGEIEPAAAIKASLLGGKK